MQKKLGMQILYNGLPRFLMDYYVLIYTHHWGADEVSGQPWQLITTIPDECDGPTFCDNSHKVTTCTTCVVTFQIVVVKISLQFHRYVQQESNSGDVVVDNLQGAYTLGVCHITPIPESQTPRQ